MDYGNLDWNDGQVNIPGIRPVVFYIPKNHIAVHAVINPAAATAVEDVTYVGSHTLVEGKTWKRLSLLDEKSPVTFEPQGEQSSRSFLNKSTLKVPLTEEQAASFAKRANNDDFVYLVQEKMGKYRQIGNDMFRTSTTVLTALGGAPTDERAMTLEVSCTDGIPGPYYDGSIVTDDGDVNPQV